MKFVRGRISQLAGQVKLASKNYCILKTPYSYHIGAGASEIFYLLLSNESRFQFILTENIRL